jgi:ubiquinone/menaquinone biosynthesis C-methylase UbiE
MITWLNPESNWWVLDVAICGGHVAKTISPYVYHVCATDLTKKMLEAARSHVSLDRLNVSYIEADAEKLPFLDQTVDLVICRIAVHHFPNPKVFLQETARVLKKNGKNGRTKWE